MEDDENFRAIKGHLVNMSASNFQCAHCDYTTDVIADGLHHAKYNLCMRYRCGICPFCTNTNEEWRAHYQTHPHHFGIIERRIDLKQIAKDLRESAEKERLAEERSAKAQTFDSLDLIRRYEYRKEDEFKSSFYDTVLDNYTDELSRIQARYDDKLVYAKKIEDFN